jgi:hypothetical protein
MEQLPGRSTTIKMEPKERSAGKADVLSKVKGDLRYGVV